MRQGQPPAPPPTESTWGGPAGWIDAASWLAPDVLLGFGWFHRADGQSVAACLLTDDTKRPIDLQFVSYRRPDVPGDDHTAGKVFLAHLSKATTSRDTPALVAGQRNGHLGALALGPDAEQVVLGPQDVGKVVVDLPTLVRMGLGWDDATRASILELVEHARAGNGFLPDLTRSLQSLRENLVSPVVSAEWQPRIHVDWFVALDTHAHYVRGWSAERHAELRTLTAISPRGERVELLDRVFRHPRPDVARELGLSPRRGQRAGYICYFETRLPVRRAMGWAFEVTDLHGATATLELPPQTHGDPRGARGAILADLAHERRGTRLIQEHTHRALQRLESLAVKTPVDEICAYGRPPAEPAISIVVPLYRRIDFLQHQLAQFVHDPMFGQVDLVYVLDSPELAEELHDTAQRLQRLYRIPFRIATLTENAGFSTACNLGAELAVGRLLLLLNSDVIPDRPGWLERLAEFHDGSPGIGALGPKLLYPDDSLQHAGMFFFRPEGQESWDNRHYFKGFPRSHPAANIARPVPAVTGACLMIARQLYTELGGLRNVYVQGDYEDSDLCLRLIEAGRTNWYQPAVELYHLEGQSYEDQTRRNHLRYNRWLHTQQWSRLIPQVMDRYPDSPRG